MSKYQEWLENQPTWTREYLKKQPVWRDVDIFKSVVIGAVIGFLVGVVVGYEWAFKPVVNTFRPLIG